MAKYEKYLITEDSNVMDKAKKLIGKLDRWLDADTRTPKELLQQIKDLDDRVLTIWYKNRVKFAGWNRMFQDKAVQREMKKRGLI